MKKKWFFLNFLSFSLFVFLCGCTTPPLNPIPSSKIPDFGSIYNKSAQYQGMEKNPVIVIHGILGAKLVDSNSGRNVWGEFSGSAFLPHDAEGMRMFSFPMEFDVPLHELKDSIIPRGALENIEVQLLGLSLRLNAYGNILQVLGSAQESLPSVRKKYGLDYGEDHFKSFQFSYDWRRDIAENAKALSEFIELKKTYIQAEYLRRYGVSKDDIKFDIVAHSMGGLIARYYLMYGASDLPSDGSQPVVSWAGAPRIEKMIMIGTPNNGILEPFLELVNGVRFIPLIPQAKYEAALLGTFPSYYQLFPPKEIHAVVDSIDGSDINIYDPELWISMGWGLASPDQNKILRALLPHAANDNVRREIALDHLKKCLHRAERIVDALHVEPEPPSTVAFYLFAGDSESTDAVVSVNKNDFSLRVIEQAPGDGIVLRSSALMDKRFKDQWSNRLQSPIPWKSVMFVFADHLRITEDPSFIDNLLFKLLEE